MKYITVVLFLTCFFVGNTQTIFKKNKDSATKYYLMIRCGITDYSESWKSVFDTALNRYAYYRSACLRECHNHKDSLRFMNDMIDSVNRFRKMLHRRGNVVGHIDPNAELGDGKVWPMSDSGDTVSDARVVVWSDTVGRVPTHYKFTVLLCDNCDDDTTHRVYYFSEKKGAFFVKEVDRPNSKWRMLSPGKDSATVVVGLLNLIYFNNAEWMRVIKERDSLITILKPMDLYTPRHGERREMARVYYDSTHKIKQQ